MVERIPDKNEVDGSIPSTPTIQGGSITIAPHFFAGAAIATLTSNPFVAFLMGFVLHFLLDALPHTDPGLFNTKKKWPVWLYVYVAIELSLTILVFVLLFYKRSDFTIISLGALGNIFPDILENMPIDGFKKLPIIKQLSWFHNAIHFSLQKKDWFWGLPIEIIVLGGSIWLLLKF